jgi:hypothetical protein
LKSENREAGISKERPSDEIFVGMGNVIDDILLQSQPVDFLVKRVLICSMHQNIFAVLRLCHPLTLVGG